MVVKKCVRNTLQETIALHLKIWIEEMETQMKAKNRLRVKGTFLMNQLMKEIKSN